MSDNRLRVVIEMELAHATVRVPILDDLRPYFTNHFGLGEVRIPLTQSLMESLHLAKRDALFRFGS